jgi:hypothetical protein
MTNMEKYSIVDLRGYAVAMRDGAAKSFTENYSENLDDFISIDQTIELIVNKTLGLDEDGHYLINEKIFDEIFDDIRDWLYGVGLAKLAAKGYVECAWDDKLQSMVFWLADKQKTPIPAKPSHD